MVDAAARTMNSKRDYRHCELRSICTEQMAKCLLAHFIFVSVQRKGKLK